MSKNTTDADVAFISALAELLNKNDLTELSVKRDYGVDDSLNVRVVKQANVVNVQAPVQYSAAQMAAPMVAVAAVPGAAPAASDDPSQHPGCLTSPMVGTCYLSAEPGAAAFVGLGTVVAEGETVLIIEAMKTMNHIPAHKAGVIKRIMVSDGHPVEFGAPLMIIE
jgi:acetyl-CoA carboxylase biotin carboxyl carrier protein